VALETTLHVNKTTKQGKVAPDHQMFEGKQRWGIQVDSIELLCWVNNVQCIEEWATGVCVSWLYNYTIYWKRD